MFDTMTVTKAGGALCGSLLVFLLAGWAGTSLYGTEDGHYLTEGGEPKQGYVVVTEVIDSKDALPDGGPGFELMYANASVDAGAKVFGKCRACHKVDGSNATGPHLDGVVNRARGTADGFAYSDTLKGMSGENWTPENLDHFLTNPKAYAPGNKMSFAGLPKAEDRANLIKYLESLGG